MRGLYPGNGLRFPFRRYSRPVTEWNVIIKLTRVEYFEEVECRVACVLDIMTYIKDEHLLCTSAPSTLVTYRRKRAHNRYPQLGNQKFEHWQKMRKWSCGHSLPWRSRLSTFCFRKCGKVSSQNIEPLVLCRMPLYDNTEISVAGQKSDKTHVQLSQRARLNSNICNCDRGRDFEDC